MKIIKAIGALTAVSAACVGYGYIEAQIVKVLRGNYYTHKLSKNREIKLVHFTDVHLAGRNSYKLLEQTVAKIEAQRPDIVLFTGDMIDTATGRFKGEGMAGFLLSRIKAPLGKYAVIGNHEYEHGTLDQYQSIMDKGGFTILKNQKINICENIAVFGVDDMSVGYGSPQETFTSVNHSQLNITLCHEPDVAREIFDLGGDMVFSGHSHWGQIRLPYFIDLAMPPLCYEFSKGQYQQGDKIVYVGAGIGTTRIPMRFMAPPSIMVYKIKGTAL